MAGSGAELEALTGFDMLRYLTNSVIVVAVTVVVSLALGLVGSVVAACGAAPSPTAITISDPNDLELGDLLVISETAMADLEQDQVVEVVGTVQADFQLTQVETELALDLEDEWFQDFEGDPYIEATGINMDAPAQ